MRSSTDGGVLGTLMSMLAKTHRTLEIALDQLTLEKTPASIVGLQQTVAVLKSHYAEEDRLFEKLAAGAIPLAGKMLRQHAEGCEIGAALEEAVAAGNERDADMLLRRFRAIVQHNIIEEERDLFPLIERATSLAENPEWLREFLTHEAGR